MIDFSECERDYSRTYDGSSGKKICVIYNGSRYLLKFASVPAEREWNKGRHEKYSNSCASEHVACNVLRHLGMNVQDTILGTYSTDNGVKDVVACKDFTEGGLRFASFVQLKNSCLNNEGSNGTGTELSEIMEAIEEQRWLEPAELRSFFWDMFMGDALVGNFDRHNGNWGFLLDDNGKAEVAPIFDCGSCLFPQLETSRYPEILSKREEIDIRVYDRPAAAIKVDNKRINYFDFISSLKNGDCNEALLRILPRIDISGIIGMIHGMQELSDIQKEFYCTILGERYHKILKFSFDKLTGK